MSAIAAVGENSLVDNAVSRATVRATTFCELTVLTRTDFNAASEHVPALRYFLLLYVSQRDATGANADPNQKRRSLF